MNIDVFYVTAIISLVIPIVTGLLTKLSLSSGVKGLITLVLNAVNALVVNNVVDGGAAFISKETFVTFVFGLIVSVAIYAGVYKPLDITSSKPEGKLAPQSGLG